MIKKFNEFTKDRNLYDIIPNSIKDLSKIFTSNGKKLYLVGGAVRDFINNEDPKDFDLCTDAKPDEILKIIGRKYRTTEQGKSFGVVVVYTEDQPMGMEIATFREDIYGDKLGETRNPEVSFTTIDKDVLRRDIPFNAMFYDLEKKEIIDLVGGLKDIENKVTRFVGVPKDRIIEDPLRILRLLRFSCRYNFRIEEDTFKAILENANMLSIIVSERIWDEMNKAWKQAKDYNKYLDLFTEFGLWEFIFPDSNINTNLIESKDFSIVMANLFRNESISAKLEKKLVEGYKMESNFVKSMIFLISLSDLSVSNAPDFFRRKRQLVENGHMSNSRILEWLKLIGDKDPIKLKFVEYNPVVSSSELISKGFKNRDLGIEIKRLEIEQFEKLLRNDI